MGSGTPLAILEPDGIKYGGQISIYSEPMTINWRKMGHGMTGVVLGLSSLVPYEMPY